jgi:DNA-binding NarL/FixJ family response regulator
MDESLRKRTVSITLRGALRTALEQTAAATERSLSAEIEFQLEELALLRDLIPALRRPGRFLQVAVFLQASESVEEETGKLWDEDEGLAELVVARAASAILNLRRSKALGVKRYRAQLSGATEPDSNDQHLSFTPRELEVLPLLRKGSPNALIAYELGMAESTLKAHIRHIMKKLNARNRTRVVLPTRDADSRGAMPEISGRQLLVASLAGALARMTNLKVEPDLSPRQRQVAELVRQGNQIESIASELDVSETAVEVHIQEMITRLDAQERKRRDANYAGYLEAKQRVGEK